MVSYDKLQELEKTKQILLPNIYKDFFERCARARPQATVGTDLINDVEDLNHPAEDLLTECGAALKLKGDDFVFMMHQGYMFWFFSANGDSDPIVFGYRENNHDADVFGPLSKFLTATNLM